MVFIALFCWELNVPLSLCRPPHPLTKKLWGKGKYVANPWPCESAIVFFFFNSFSDFAASVVVVVVFFAFGRAGEGLAETRGLWKKWKARFENLDIKQGLPIAIYIACVASVSARVRRERWDESKKKGMTGKGEGTVILHRDMENSVFPLLPSPSPFHFVFFAPAPTFALKLDWKRLLRRLPFIFFKVWLENWLEGHGVWVLVTKFFYKGRAQKCKFPTKCTHSSCQAKFAY